MIKGWNPFHQSGVESVSRTPKESIATCPVSFFAARNFCVYLTWKQKHFFHMLGDNIFQQVDKIKNKNKNLPEPDYLALFKFALSNYSSYERTIYH